MNEVYILGGGRTDFKRNLKKEGKTIRHIITEAGKKAIDGAKIDPGEIQAGAVGNFNAGQFTKQLQLGAFIPEIDPKLRGIPTMHTEAACASGALSVLLGAEWIMGGLYDAVLVVGAEQQKTMSSLDGSDVLGAAAKNIGPIERRHRLLLLRTNDEHGIVKSAHDPFRAEQNRERPRCARGFGVHRRNSAQLRIDLRNE